MSKYICEACKRPCKITVSVTSGAPKCCPYNMIWKAPMWNKVNEEQTVTDCNQLPKLTAEVFDRPDCPEWAMYAAVHNEKLFFTDQKPEINEHGLFVSANDAARIEKILAIPFKSSEHYLSQVIKRPAKKSELPDWCKVGEWVWINGRPDRLYYNGYGKITQVEPYIDVLMGTDDNAPNTSISLDSLSPARLRPYNAEEMKSLVGKIICGNDTNFRAMIVYADGVSGVVETIHYDYDAEELAQSYTIDGKPCGKLEHLENGEWVE